MLRRPRPLNRVPENHPFPAIVRAKIAAHGGQSTRILQGTTCICLILSSRRLKNDEDLGLNRKILLTAEWRHSKQKLELAWGTVTPNLQSGQKISARRALAQRSTKIYYDAKDDHAALHHIFFICGRARPIIVFGITTALFHETCARPCPSPSMEKVTAPRTPNRFSPETGKGSCAQAMISRSCPKRFPSWSSAFQR